VIYETATAIHAIERDGRDVRNDITLATGDGLNGLALSSDGKTLYFNAKKDGLPSLETCFAIKTYFKYSDKASSQLRNEGSFVFISMP